MKRFIAIFITATLLLLTSATAQAMTLIRDTEIESYMAEWFAPIMRAAGMQPGTVDVYLVKDDNVNAFVAGGSNIFFHTGLLTKSENADEVIGVFAHELGHVTGGHLIRAREAQTQSATKMIVSTLVGIGAAILSGDSGAAGAAIQTGQAIGITDYLAHSRVQESAADQAALTYLAQAGKDPSGLLTFLEKLQSQELLPASQQVAYARTHPITRDRIEALRHRHDQIEAQFQNRDSTVERKRKSDQHARMRAKLIGFLSPERVERFYPESDTSLPARYAR